MLKITSIAMALAFALPLAGHAAEGTTKQQNKMATCSAEFKATGKDGKERQAYMKDCLSADGKEKQQTRMGTCSDEFKATGKDGKERQAFMKQCLSTKPTAAAGKPADLKPATAMAPVATPAAAPAVAAAPAPKK